MKLVSLLIVLTGLVAQSPKHEKPTLPDAIADWVALVEKDNASAAARRWAKDDEAAAQMRALWTSVRAAHRAHDYRTWADGKGGNDAAKVGKATKFKLGGHEFGHTHVDWELTDAGWRVAGVWVCR